MGWLSLDATCRFLIRFLGRISSSQRTFICSLSLPQNPIFVNEIFVFWVCFWVVGSGLWIWGIFCGSLIFLFSLIDWVRENGTLSRLNLKLELTSTMEFYGLVKAANHAKIEDFDASTRRHSSLGSKSHIFDLGFSFIWVCLHWEVARIGWVWRGFALMVFVWFKYF